MVDVLSAEERVEPRPRKRSRLLVVALVLIGAVAAFLLSGAGRGEEADVPAPVADGAIIAVDSLTVSMADERFPYVRVGFAVVLAEGADEAGVKSRLPLLRDAALTTISSSSAGDLRTPEGLDVLRSLLSEEARRLYPDGEVVRVVLTEVTVQQ